MIQNEKRIYVYADWYNSSPVFIGTLFVTYLKGKETFSFEYDTDWVANNSNLFLDPDLSLFSGRQYVPLDKNNFGIFSDSCPDRWGRTLMKRREALQAKKEKRKPKKLNESDFLLGVYDASRMGALRFKTDKNGDFLSSDETLATPPWTTLRKLETASIAFENSEDGNEEKWLKQLLAPGSSLGGARPKASVEAPDGSLWIAKFPSKHDEFNSGAWEMIIHDLAVLCGLNVPEAKLETFSKYGSTFLIKRFDRHKNHRIHFTSAMTLLGKTDSAYVEDGTSYLDILSFIKGYSVSPIEDSRELWKRIVFNIAVSNTDDHLRNHGFILTQEGWQLSPLYDVNPNVYGEYLSLNIDESDNSLKFELALNTCELYGITEDEATKIIDDIKNIVSYHWINIAKKYGLSRSSIEYMKPAFDMEYK